MGHNTPPVKLKHGTMTRVARRYGVTVAHVSMILKGQRVGRPSLMAALEREAEKQELERRANAA